MGHWLASCALNALLLGDPHEPLCARVYLCRDCTARRAFLRFTDWYFAEANNCRRMHDIAALGRMLRG